MRTTLSIDDDVLAAVHEQARHERTTAGQVVSRLLRQALTTPSAPVEDDSDEFYGFRPFPHRGGVVTNELINDIRDELGI